MSTATQTDQLVADLQAIASFLATMKDAGNYDSVREGQVLALIQRVQSMRLKPQDGTALVNAWQQGPWTQTQSQRFSEAIAAVVSNQSNAATDKRGMQHLSSFEHFLSVKDIEILGGQCNNTMKLECLASRCCRLRLVCPSEPSVRAILAAGVAHGANLGSPSESYAHSVTFKKILKQKAKQVGRNGIHLLHYPSSVEELPAELRTPAHDADDPACSPQSLSPADVRKASGQLVIRGSDKRVKNSGTGGFMQTMQQPWPNPMGMGMGSMPDPSSSMTMMRWLRGMQCMQQMMQPSNPDQLLSNLQMFRPGQSQQASQATANVQQQALVTSSSSASGQNAACTAGVQQPSQVALQSPSRETATVFQDLQNSPPAGGVAPGKTVQTELDDDGILAAAALVSNSLDEKKGERSRASTSFKNGSAKGKGKGAKKTKGKGKGKKGTNGDKTVGKKGNGKGEGNSTKVMKKPAMAKAKAMANPATGTREYYANLPMKKRLALRPHGCSKCRWSPGCRIHKDGSGCIGPKAQAVLKDESQVNLPVLNLPAFLWHLRNDLPQFATFFQKRMHVHPNGPDRAWTMTLYSDEISPGNQLKVSNSRKVHGFYVTFDQFGAEARCRENFWFCLSLARSSVVNQLLGGLSGLTHELISSGPVKALTTGCMLTMPDGQRCMFFAKLGSMLGDESAWKFVFDVKGASGTLPCPLCSNIISRINAAEDYDATGTLRSISCTDPNDFVLRTDAEIFRAHELLERRQATMSKKDYTRLEQSLGLNCNPNGVLHYRSMPLVQSLMFDWMHVFLVTGLGQTEMGLLLPLLYSAGHSAETLLAYMMQIQWPQNLRGRINETLQLFKKKTSPNEFKSSASQGLNAYPLVRMFLLSLDVSSMDDALKLAVRSFLKLCIVLDILLSINRGESDASRGLEGAIQQHCQAFIRAHGEDHCTPKFHYAQHLGSMAASKDLVSCFTHERKHKEVKNFADHIKNPTKGFEDAIMKDVLGRLLLKMEGSTGLVQPHLIPPKPASLLLMASLVSASVGQAQGAFAAQVSPGCIVHKADFVKLKSGDVAEVWLHARLGSGDLVTLLQPFAGLGRNMYQQNAGMSNSLQVSITPVPPPTMGGGIRKGQGSLGDAVLHWPGDGVLEDLGLISTETSMFAVDESYVAATNAVTINTGAKHGVCDADGCATTEGGATSADRAITAQEGPPNAQGKSPDRGLFVVLKLVDTGEQGRPWMGATATTPIEHKGVTAQAGCGEPSGLIATGAMVADDEISVREINARAAAVGVPNTGPLSTMAPLRMLFLFHPRASTATVVLNRRDIIDGCLGALAEEAYSGKASAKAWESIQSLGGPPPGLAESERMEEEPEVSPSGAATASASSPTPTWSCSYFANKGMGKGKGMGAPPSSFHLPQWSRRGMRQGILHMRGLQTVVEPPPGPAPKKARGPAEKDRPMAIVVSNGEALWFTVRALDESTPHMVLPWSVFQHVVMCRRALCGLQSWGRVGVIVIRRIAQDILHWARRKGYMSRIYAANQSNPCFMDLQEAYPEPQGDLPPLSPATGDHRTMFTYQDFLRNPSLGQDYRAGERPPRPGRTDLPCIYPAPLHQLLLAETYAEADQARNVMGRWAMRMLGDEPAVPPDEGVPPAEGGAGDSAQSSHPPEQCVVSDDEEAENDIDLNEDEVAEVVKATNDTARNDPKYVADLEAGVTLAAAFQRHRSRFRAVQHQVAQGNVALQPRATPLQTVRTLPPMMSLGRSHRLYLLNRLERLERQGVTWTQDEVGDCYTMEQFLDYLEARVRADAERAEPTTASKSAGAPPHTGAPPQGNATSSTSTASSSAPTSTTAAGRPDLPRPPANSPEDPGTRRPVPPQQGNDPPEAQPSAFSATIEGREEAGDTAQAEADLPADDSARRSAVGGYRL
ncbi:unnamed protein product [Symbiodinium sp. CCMP2592]|nr:unnamed protein product [Symbiodinium sp. CCMP2592]